MKLSTIFVSFSDTGQYQHRSRVRSAPSYDSDFDKQYQFGSRKTWKDANTSRLPSLGPSLQSSSIATCLDAQSKQDKHVYFYEACWFSHFAYIYNLMMKCKNRIEKGQKKNPVLKDCFIKIEVIGPYTEENLKFISKRKGKCEIAKDHLIWATLLVCFQNDLSTETALQILRSNSAEHKILIKSNSVYNGYDNDDSSIIIVGQHKQQIKETITSCLENPFHKMLQMWLELLKPESSCKHALGAIAEIEAIRKQMTFDRNKETSFLPVITVKSNVPTNVKDYLFGRSDVNSFGIWRNSSFKVFVHKETDEKELENILTRINKTFFNKYHIEIEKGKLIEKKTLKQGSPIQSNNGEGTCFKGTLGGFVEKTKDKRKKYALTCDHLFHDNNQIAYADDSDDDAPKQIGTCVFKTRDRSCDFAAIEIEQRFSEKCEITFRREDKKKTNAHVYSKCLENIGFVHKIGSKTDVTSGCILSSEFYNNNNISDDVNRESIFLVKGTDEKFSDEGDSGSLVFSRPRNVNQNYVDVIGMVYANNQTVYDKENSGRTHETNGANSTENADEISSCFRIHTALELFKESQGQNFEVNFKNDLPSSSSSTSESDD